MSEYAIVVSPQTITPAVAPQAAAVAIALPQTIVATSHVAMAVIVDVPSMTVIEAGQQGPEGPPGPPGAGAGFSIVAGETMGGDSVVIVLPDGLAYLASASNAGHAGFVVGLTNGAVTAGNTVSINVSGLQSVAGLLPGQHYFLGEAGAVSTTPPVSGFLQTVGVGHPNGLVIGIGMPIVRA